MATTATLTVNAADIIGADFDPSRASVWVEANTPHSLIVVDGTTLHVGGRRENLVDGVATFELVTTDSAENPESFGYRVTIVYVPKGSRKQGHDQITTSDFSFTADANLAAIEEAWDNVTAPASWRSEFRAEMEALRDEVVDLSSIDTPDALVATLVEDEGSATGAALSATFAAVKSVPQGLGNGTTDATAGIQSVIDAANTAGVGVYVPAGNYKVTAPIENVRRLHLAEGARIFGDTASMAAVVRTQSGARLDGGYITGKGVIDAGANAAIGVHVRDFLHFAIDGIQVWGGTTAAIKLGSTGSSGRSAEGILSNLRLITNGTVPAGARGVLVENAGDHSFSQLLIQNYEVGITLPVAGNAMVHDVHAWTEPAKGAMTIGFEDRSNNSHYVQCHADTPTQFGWRLYGYQTTLVQCGTYNNPAASTATDNVAVGVKFEGAGAIGTIVGHYFLGGDSAHRLKADIETVDGNYSLITATAMVGQHTVTTRARYSRALGYVSREGFWADHPTGLAQLGYGIRTNGLARWNIGSDGVAETGSNAGTGFEVRKYADDGTTSEQVLFIARSSGTIVAQKSISIADGQSIVAGSGTGLKIGTSATQKIGFYGLPPVVQPSGTPADATDLATALTLVNNLKGKLKTLGLIV